MMNFQRGFTHEQKAAIISSLLIISKTKAGFTVSEIKYIEQNASMLSIRMEDPTVIKIFEAGKANLFDILNTMSRSNKEWMSLSIHGLLYSNGIPNQVQISLAMSFINNIGITDTEFFAIVETSKSIHKYLSE